MLPWFRYFSFPLIMATPFFNVFLLFFLLFSLHSHIGEAIHCWDCNSAYDPRCGDPFDNHSIALVDCSQMSYTHLAVKEATFCRKTTQKGEWHNSFRSPFLVKPRTSHRNKHRSNFVLDLHMHTYINGFPLPKKIDGWIQYLSLF